MEVRRSDITKEELLKVINDGNNILLTGPGGVGKTVMLKNLAIDLVSSGKTVACTATTGVSAINLSSAEHKIASSTVHKWAGIGIGDDDVGALIKKIYTKHMTLTKWLETDVLIIDEISMMGLSLFEKLDEIGRTLRKRMGTPFGGIRLVLSGDFLQLPPVRETWVFQSECWKACNLIPYILEEPKRYNDLEWFGLLLRVRKEQHTEEDIDFLRSRHIAYQEWIQALNEIADEKGINAVINIVKPTVLYSRRIDVEAENNMSLDYLEGESVSYMAVDTFKAYKRYARIESYQPLLDEIIPKLIVLKVGAQVMLRANLDIDAGLANGSRGVVVGLTADSVKVKWLNGSITTHSEHTWEIQDKDGFASRTQIPFILAWSMTIHKLQGCTLDYAICDLGPSVFCPGQAYVALSRVRSSAGLLLKEFYAPIIKTDKQALAFVDLMEGSEIVTKYQLIFPMTSGSFGGGSLARKLMG